MSYPIKPKRVRTQIIRLYKIEEELITRNGMRVIELCNCMGVNRRTIYRDLALMQELGIPVYKEDHLFNILGTYKIPSYRPKILDPQKP